MLSPFASLRGNFVQKPVITQVVSETIGGAVQVDLSTKELSEVEREQMARSLHTVKVCLRSAPNHFDGICRTLFANNVPYNF